jgi:hypothetical protein
LFWRWLCYDRGSFNAEVVDVKTKKRTILIRGCLYARYVVSGHLLFIDDGSLNARAFNTSTLELKGVPQVVKAQVAVNEHEAAQYTVSTEGTLACVQGHDYSGTANRKLVWLNLEDEQEPKQASSLRGTFWVITRSLFWRRYQRVGIGSAGALPRTPPHPHLLGVVG